MSRLIPFSKVVNVRDLGGMPAADGRRIKDGKLVRSGMLFRADEADREKLASLIGTVADLRSDTERQEMPDPALPGVSFLHHPVLPSFAPGITRDEASYEEHMKILSSDPVFAADYMCGLYRKFITDEYIVSRYASLMRLLMEEREKAVLWHCTAGKDRAGFASIILEEILGVPRELIREDYMQSNAYLQDDFRDFLEKTMRRIRGEEAAAPDAAEGSGGSADEAACGNSLFEKIRDAAGYLFFAKEVYLKELYSTAEEVYGGFEGFIRNGLGITDEEIRALRELYLA